MILTSYGIFQMKHILRIFKCQDFTVGLAFYFYEHCHFKFSRLTNLTPYDQFLGCLLIAMKLSFDDRISNRQFSDVSSIHIEDLMELERQILDQLGFRLNPFLDKKEQQSVLDCTSRMLSTLYG
eukprot:NODE_319_length_9908_cov_1.288001.p9 type:complete len:124 gc:universal NODE_319_length_9908_cov_1.288001:966-1337(+)